MNPTDVPDQLGRLIRTLRDQRVILDADLAAIYGVETRALNQAVKRNLDRFPADFWFELTREEVLSLSSSGAAGGPATAAGLKSQIVMSKPGRGGRRSAPYAFNEHGALMAATVLNSPAAVKMSLFLVRTFVQLREELAANATILKRLAEIDKTLLEHNAALRTVWSQLQPLLTPPPAPPRRRIGFLADVEKPTGKPVKRKA